MRFLGFLRVKKTDLKEYNESYQEKKNKSFSPYWANFAIIKYLSGLFFIYYYLMYCTLLSYTSVYCIIFISTALYCIVHYCTTLGNCTLLSLLKPFEGYCQHRGLKWLMLLGTKIDFSWLLKVNNNGTKYLAWFIVWNALHQCTQIHSMNISQL